MTSLDMNTPLVEAEPLIDADVEMGSDPKSILDGWTEDHTKAFQSEILSFRH